MSQGTTQDPLKRGETMRANFIVEKLKPLIPYLGNNEALKLHINRAILNANGDFKLAIKNIDNIPSGNLPTPTRNLLNEFKIAIKDIEQMVKTQEPTQIKSENQVNLAKTKEPTQEPVKAEAKKEAENLAQYRKDIEAKYNITPIKEFGINYAEFYHDGKNAIRKLLVERKGQVAGAFERKELEKLSGNGDITLPWGEVTDKVNHKGYGLAHILDKRIAEFIEQGLNPQQAEQKAMELINKLPEIIKNGKIEQKGGRFRIQKDDYVIGLTSEYKGEKRNWIITAFQKDKKGNPQSFTEADFTAKSDNLLSNPIKNSTTTANKSQAGKGSNEAKASIQAKAKQYAKFLSEAKEPTQVAPDELYKAYNKAKKDLKNRKG